MLNQIILVGRLVATPEVKELENEKNVANITVAVPRSYKNSEGQYDTDFVSCVLWKGIAESTVSYCKKGDLVGVKGHIQTRKYEDSDEVIHNVTEVIAEKVTFLSSKKAD